MNNTIKLFSAAFMALSLSSCDLDKFTAVNFDYKTETVIQTNALPVSGTQVFGESVITSTLKDELEKNNTSIDLLDELKLKSIVISHEGDSSANFDNVDNIEFWLAADGNPEVLIASKNPVADGQNSITLDVNNNENLVNYIKATTFTYRIKGTNSAPLPPMNLKANVVFAVKASAK